MEDVMVTIERVNDIWLASNDKRPFLESFGFSIDSSFLHWVADYVKGSFHEGIDTYTAIEEEKGWSYEDAIVRGTVLALADAAIIFMMLGRERERLSSLEAAVNSSRSKHEMP